MLSVNRKTAIIILILILCIATTFSLLLIRHKVKYLGFKEVVAEVEEVYFERHYGHSGNSTLYFAVYKYTIDGKEYSTHARVPSFFFHNGKKTVLYNPENPSKIADMYLAKTYKAIMIFSFVLAALLALIVHQDCKKWRGLKPPKERRE